MSKHLYISTDVVWSVLPNIRNRTFDHYWRTGQLRIKKKTGWHRPKRAWNLVFSPCYSQKNGALNWTNLNGLNKIWVPEVSLHFYRVTLEGGLNNKMAENSDVIEYSLEMLWRHWRAFHKKINGIHDVYRNNSSNFETK